jgi:ATP adenylyltransferase
MSKRFNWVTLGLSRGPDPLCDIDLLQHPAAGVVPTLGSLLPGWLLVVPRIPSLSLHQLSSNQRQRVFAVAQEAARCVSNFGHRTFIFEHGPTESLSAMGCGVDQSHVHVLAMDGDLLETALADVSVIWNPVSTEDRWSKCRDGREYLLICEKDRCYVGSPHSPQSQYFRRKIAQIQGKPDAWDYRGWPCYENVQRTIGHCATFWPQRRAA